MSDHDRGAYTPDAQLAFDARAPRGRRSAPWALIGSAVVLLALVAAVLLYYRAGVRGEGEPPQPVGQPVTVIKTPPTPAQQAQEAAKNPDVVQNLPSANTTAAPNFTAGPEQPAPRTASGLRVQLDDNAVVTPKAPAPAPASSNASEAKPDDSGYAPVTTDEKAVRNRELAAARARPSAAGQSAAGQSAASQAALAQAQPTKPAQPAETDGIAAAIARVNRADAGVGKRKAKPVQTASAAGGAASAKVGGALVQIGAVSSTTLADAVYKEVAALMSGQMSGKHKHVEPVEKNGATLYRTAVTGFASRTDAASFCAALKSKGKSCLVKG